MTELNEDFLENDAPIHGQKYVLLSFVSPEKFIAQKELFSFHKYLKQNSKKFNLLSWPSESINIYVENIKVKIF